MSGIRPSVGPVRPVGRVRPVRLAFLPLALLAAPVFAQSTLLVHLPSAPVETASRLAEAVTELAQYLSEKTPGQSFEPQLFRRWSDAHDALTSGGDRVALTLTDAAFLVALEAGSGLTPTHRLVREGRGTYRRLLVVRADQPGFVRLSDLRGRTLGVVETAGPAEAAYVERAVFEGEVDPGTWFSRLEPMADDFTATSAVLYGQTDAALVAEHNPLLRDHLGRDLKSLYTSPPLSLPVLALREGALDTGQRRAFDDAMRDLPADPRGRKLLEALRADGFASLPAAEAVRLAALPSAGGKELEIALPGAAALAVTPAPLPPATQLPFLLAVELPEIPLPREGEQR